MWISCIPKRKGGGRLPYLKGDGVTYSSQFLVFVKWIPTKAHHHWVHLGLSLAERTRRWTVHQVVGSTSGHLGVTEVYAWGCDVDHLGERIIWQVCYPQKISLTVLFVYRLDRPVGHPRSLPPLPKPFWTAPER